jgi:hypothetical protein
MKASPPRGATAGLGVFDRIEFTNLDVLVECTGSANLDVRARISVRPYLRIEWTIL